MRNGYLNVSFHQNRNVGFKPKSLDGYRRDLKFVCAGIGRLDLYERAVKFTLGVKAFRSMINAAQRSAEHLERYIETMEAQRRDRPVSEVAQVFLKRERDLLNSKSYTGVRKRANAALALPDPCAHLGEGDD
jgi:hypothetical protein